MTQRHELRPNAPHASTSAGAAANIAAVKVERSRADGTGARDDPDRVPVHAIEMNPPRRVAAMSQLSQQQNPKKMGASSHSDLDRT